MATGQGNPPPDSVAAQAAAHLHPDEHILAWAEGRHLAEMRRPKAAIIATDKRIIFYGSKLIGHALHTFNYSQVDAIGSDTGTLGTTLVVTAGATVVRLDRIRGDVTHLQEVINART
jgi:hypothetical protein